MTFLDGSDTRHEKTATSFMGILCRTTSSRDHASMQFQDQRTMAGAGSGRICVFSFR